MTTPLNKPMYMFDSLDVQDAMFNYNTDQDGIAVYQKVLNWASSDECGVLAYVGADTFDNLREDPYDSKYVDGVWVERWATDDELAYLNYIEEFLAMGKYTGFHWVTDQYDQYLADVVIRTTNY